MCTTYRPFPGCMAVVQQLSPVVQWNALTGNESLFTMQRKNSGVDRVDISENIGNLHIFDLPEFKMGTKILAT